MNEFEVGQLAQRLAQDYYAFVAALTVASDPRAVQLMPATLPGYAVPVGVVGRKDGTEHVFYFEHFLGQPANERRLAEDFKRVWLVGGLLTLGDALAGEDYLDHAAELEMVFHLRNGVAHGNRFHFTARGLRRLGMYPAHTRDAYVRSDLRTEFEITPDLEGRPVLFGYMEAADVLDLLMSVGEYLLRIANGQPGHA